MAKFKQVHKQVCREIVSGGIGSPGDRFMTVRELAERYAISLSTAQKVVKQLKDDGLLIADTVTSPPRISASAVRYNGAASDVSPGPRRLGLVVTDITNPFFARLCRYIQGAASEQGYQVLVASSQSEFAREDRAIQGFLEIGVQGLLICPGLDEDCRMLYRDLHERGLPMTFVSRRVEDLDVDFVVAHNFVGGASMAGHLLSMGYKTFGYVGFGPRLKRDDRLLGFRSALSEQNIELLPTRIAGQNGRDIQHGYRAMARLMVQRDRPRAVFAFNDLLAIGALHYCHENDLAVPGDVAIAGFDNLPESRVTSPPLTTVAYPIQSIARLAVQSLDDRIGRGSDRSTNRILLEPRLIVRRSTDPAADGVSSRTESEGDAIEHA